MEQGVESRWSRRESASPPSPESSDISPPPSSSFNYCHGDDPWDPRGRISGGTVARGHDDDFGVGGNSTGEEDVYDFDATRSSRLGHSSSSKKRHAKKVSKLTPKDKAPIKTMDDRVTEILARTRSSAALVSVVPSSSPASVPEDNRNRGGGVGEGAVTDSAGALLEEGEGTFSDFAKSLRDFRGGLDLSPVTSGGEGQQSISGKGSASPRSPKIRETTLSPPAAPGETRTLLELSDSLVIDEADMEVGGYARAREKEWRRREAKSPEISSGPGGDVPEAPTDTLSPIKSPEIIAVDAEERGYGGGRGGAVVDALRQKQEQLGEGCGRAGFEGGKAAIASVSVRSPKSRVMDGQEGGSGRDSQDGEVSVSKSLDTNYEEDGFEADMEGEKEEDKFGEETRQACVEDDRDGGDEAGAGESSKPIQWENRTSHPSLTRCGVDGSVIEKGGEREEAEGVSDAGFSTPGRTSPYYGHNTVDVVSGAIPNSPGGRITLRPPHSSPPPSASVSAVEEERDCRARRFCGEGDLRVSLSGTSEASLTREALPLSPPSPPPPRPLHSPPSGDRRNFDCNDDDDDSHAGSDSGNGRSSSAKAVRVRIGMPVVREIRGGEIRGREDDVSVCDGGQDDADTMDPVGECSDASRRRGAAASVAVDGEGMARVEGDAPKGRPIFGSVGHRTDGYWRNDDGGDHRSSVGVYNRGYDRPAQDDPRPAKGKRNDNNYPQGEWRTIIAAADAVVDPVSSGPLDTPTRSPLLAELERQLSSHSPVPVCEKRGSGNRRSGVGVGAESGGRNSGRGGDGAGDPFASWRRDGREVTGDGGFSRARARSRENSARGRDGSRSVMVNRRDLGHAGRMAACPHGGSAQATGGHGPADIRSTPGQRRSSGHGAEGRPQESTACADVAPNDTPAERNLQRVKQKAAQQRRQEDGGYWHRENDRRQEKKKEEELERDLEKARAEIYALQVKLQEKRRSATPARTPSVRDARSNVYDAAGKNRNSHGGVLRGEEVVGNRAGLEAMEALRAEAEGMRKEIAEQERLLTAYQKENERLVDKAKKDKCEHEEERISLYRDRERLNKELNRLTNEKGWGSGAGNGPSSGNAVQARLQAEAELAEARTRESDLLRELDRLRVENGALETRAAQQAASSSKAAAAAREGDKEEVKKLEGAVKRLEGLLSKEREERYEEMRTTQRKLNWYAENQELVDGHLVKIRQQEEEIDRLRQDLSSKPGGKRTGRSPADVRKIKDLEAQLGELAEALRKRHPDSLASLIRATRPSESQEIRDNSHLKRVRELEAELKKHREESEVRMRALRQQHERVKSGMERQLLMKRPGSGGVLGGYGAGFDRKVKAGSCNAGIGRGVGENSAGRGSGDPDEQDYQKQQQQEDRVAELEKELSHVRLFYTRKLKEVERRAQNQMRALKRGNSRGPTPRQSVSVEKPDAEDGRLCSRDAAATASIGAAAEEDMGMEEGRRTGEHESQAATATAGAKASVRSAKEGGRGVEKKRQGSGTEAESKDGGCVTLLRSRSGSPSVAASNAAASTVPRGGNASSGETRERHRRPQEEEKRGMGGEACDDSGTGLGSEESLVGSKIEELLRAERAKHEKELERERKAAEARVAALELRLVQTAQALGKAQAREQAELWGRGNTRNEAATGGRRGETEDNRRSGGYSDSGDTSGGGEHLEVGVGRRETQHQQQQQQQRAKELELEITLAQERHAAATKDLERSENMRRALEAEVLGLRVKLSEPSTPSQAKYLDLSRKVEEMERRTARREEELRRVLSESREQSKLELRRLQALHAEEIRAKDALIHGFRAELDGLLMAAGRLMEGDAGGGGSIDSGGGVRGRGDKAPGISIAARMG